MKYILLVVSIFASILSVAQQSEHQSKIYNYLAYIPDQGVSDAGFPLIIFLHGSGECGEDLELVKTHGPPSFLDDKSDFPFIVISPQCPSGAEWDTQKLELFLHEVCGMYNVDRSRVCMTGLSVGGSATWDFAMAYPDWVAAIVPICGKGDTSGACIIKNIPVWVFHGADDDIIPSAYSDDMVKALRDCGATDVKYTLYPQTDHFSWVPAYNDHGLYSWLLEQSKK